MAEQMGGAVQSLLRKQLAERNTGLLLEDVFQVRMTQIEFPRQIGDPAKRLGLDHLNDLEHPGVRCREP